MISVVIPCLNEEKTVALCVKKAWVALREYGVVGEVLVVDNGSTDRSVQGAREAGARVIFENKRGYGSSIRRGIQEAAGHIVIMADGDGTYNFSDLKNFIQLLHEGADLVVGNRLGGRIHKNAMPRLHRWLGTPFLTWLLRLFYGVKISDVNCGMRAFKKEAMERLNLQCGGMELASEMLVKAAIEKLHIVEIAIDFFPHEPGRTSHLNPFRDGWRHLKIMLALWPRNPFRYPV